MYFISYNLNSSNQIKIIIIRMKYKQLLYDLILPQLCQEKYYQLRLVKTKIFKQ